MLCRHIFEKQKADENERAAKRMMEKPGGRRHDAFTDYHQRIQMGDEVHGFDAEAVSPCFITKPRLWCHTMWAAHLQLLVPDQQLSEDAKKDCIGLCQSLFCPNTFVKYGGKLA